MKTIPTLFIAFAAMVLLQLGLPLRTVIQHEWTLRYGETFKFETRPVDPNDPFRGKYVALDFTSLESALSQEQLKALSPEPYHGQQVYLIIEKEESGYARAVDITLAPPPDERTYFAATVDQFYTNRQGTVTLRLQYPFDRFYLEESKAPRAELRYRDANLRGNDSTEVYAQVKIRKGIAVLADVLINGQSLVED